MPELPEVETVVRRLMPIVVGRTIRDFESRWRRQIAPSVPSVRTALIGRRIERAHRRAKYIVLDLDDGSWLLIHLRMSGRFEWTDSAAGVARNADAPEPAHVRAVWRLDDDRRLYFCDARKFGRIIHTRDLESGTGRLGIEPLSRAFTTRALAGILAKRRARLKPLLLDQSLVAGLGNIYVDESLFRARLHPLMPADRLHPAQVTALRVAIRHVLRAAIRRNGTSFDWVYPAGQMQNHLQVYGRAGEKCRRCGDTIVALRVGQRGTHVCPTCQAR
ncbi:MAG: bifunctional DNA-formamidopyrimidine glycosylase/DNA-(apurinic or apyrimidinic site) lyase [Phycisphaerae bacterium]